MANLRRFVFGLLLPVSLLAIAVAACLLLLNSGQLKGPLASWASDRLGRHFAIDGKLELAFGPTLRISADRVHLANVAWGSEPEMLLAQRVLLEIDLLSLFRDTVVIPRIEVTGLDVLLERNADGLENWDFAAEEDDEPRWRGAPSLLVELITVPGARLRFASPRLIHPLEARFDRIEQRPAADASLQLVASGQVNGIPLRFTASAGPKDELLQGKNIRVAVKGNLGELALEGHGRIDDLAKPADTRLSFSFSGPDADYVTRTLGVRNLGTGPVKLQADIAPASDGRGIRGTLSGILGELSIEGSGELADPENLAKLSLQLQVAGPDLSLVGALLSINRVPPEAFTLDTRFERNGDSLRIDAATLRLRDAELQLRGSIDGIEQLTGSDLAFDLRGSDIARLRKLFHIPGIATGAFDVVGRLKHSPDSGELLDVTANSRFAKITASGPVGKYPGFENTRLQFTATGAEFADVGAALKIAGLPAGAFDARGELAWTGSGLVFRSTTLQVAGEQLRLDGLLGMQPFGGQVDLRIAMKGNNPRLLARLLALPGLPARPYTLSGHMLRDQGPWRIDDVEAALADARLSISGQLGNPPGLAGLDLSFSAEGADLAAFSGVARRTLPEGSFKAAGELKAAPAAIRLEQLNVSVGGLHAAGLVTVDLPLSARRGHFDISATGPRLDTVVPELNWLPLARQSAELRARGTWEQDRLELDLAQIETATARLGVKGDVNLGPVVSTTALQLDASTHDLAAAGRLSGLELPAGLTLPAAPLQLQARLSATPAAFVLQELAVRVGDTGFSGRVQVARGGKPDIAMQLQSDFLDLTPFVWLSPPAANAKPPARPKLIPDLPLPLDLLQRANGQLSLRAGTLRFAAADYTGVHLEASLRDSNLLAQRIEFANVNGTYSGRLEVQPVTAGARVRAVVSGKDLILDLGPGNSNPFGRLHYDGNIDLSGQGRTLRELAGSLQGRMRLTSSGERLSNVKLNMMYSSFFSELMRTLIPMMRREPYTDVVCAAYALRAENGVLRTDPALVMRTTDIDIAGNGTVDLRDETVDFNFKTAARAGLGISPGQMLNPYVKVSGTLAAPRLTLDPTGTLVNGGAAFATGGLSIFATTIWDRVNRQKDPCAAVIAGAERQAASAPPAQ